MENKTHFSLTPYSDEINKNLLCDKDVVCARVRETDVVLLQQAVQTGQVLDDELA